MSNPLIPRQLRYLLAVADHGSIQGASRALGIAASAIDRHVCALEDAHQTSLFERQPRGMRSTAAGEAMIVLARRWHADAERLDTTLKEMRGEERGTVRLAAMDSLANGVLPDLVGAIQADHPRIRLAIDVVTPSEAAAALDEGTVDVAIALNLPQQRHQHLLWSEELPFGCVVVPEHKLAAHAEVRLAMLGDVPTASQSTVLPIRRYLENRYGWFFDQNEPRLVTNSLQLLKHAVLGGDLALITSEMDVLPELEAGMLVFVPIREAGLKPQTISVAVDSRRNLTRVSRLVVEKAVTLMETRLAGLRARPPRDGADHPTAGSI